MSKSKKKKILLLSDDIRMHSGVARQSREIVTNTLDKYDWVQIGGAVKHPEEGKRVVVQSDENYKMPEGSSVIIYPVTGYGNPDLLRQLMELEKPDAILHFTDPRFWIWLYEMEHEVRQKCPIFYYNIWDDLPDPWYNEYYYRSSDLLMAISKQTYGINKRILKDYEDWQIKYVPHGIDHNHVFKVEDSDLKYKQFLYQYGLDKYKFKLLFLNRNIRRKNPGDVMLAYKHFMDGLTEEQRKDCIMVFHTAVRDENGTDLKAVHQALCPQYPVIFSYEVKGPMSDQELNYLFNSSDVYINLASNEGFGLGSAEALTCGTPIIVNVTGGLQDQCGFKNEKGEYLTADDYVELGSNHRGDYQKHGEWVKPVFPTNISCQGSPQTPYIFDDRCSYEDAGEAIRYWYDKGPDGRAEAGEKGMEYVSSKKIGMDSKYMGEAFIEHMGTAFEKWKPREKYTLEVV
jgi:glycosyltransferase involved in cell wall biosynthesis